MGMVMLAKESQILWKQICKIHLKGEYAMFRPTLLERIAHKVDEKTIPLFADFKRAKLNNTDFTIIYNNCFLGGSAIIISE